MKYKFIPFFIYQYSVKALYKIILGLDVPGCSFEYKGNREEENCL